MEFVNGFKECRRKKGANFFVCMPPKHIFIPGFLADQSTGFGVLSGYALEQLKVSEPDRYAVAMEDVKKGNSYLVTEEQPFVLFSYVGDMKTITPQELAARFTFFSKGTSEPINMESLNKRLDKNGFMPWVQIKLKSDESKAFAAPYGAGNAITSFLIAEDINGTPNMNNTYEISVLEFGLTFDNRGWSQYLDSKRIKEAEKKLSVHRPDLISIGMFKPNQSEDSSKQSKDKTNNQKVEQRKKYLSAGVASIISNLILTFKCEGFTVEADTNNLPQIIYERGSYKFSIKERNLNSEKSTVLNFKVDKDFTNLYMRGKRDGKKLEEKYSLSRVAIAADENIINYIRILMYLRVCALFKITPFRYICKPYFVQYILSSYNKRDNRELYVKDLKYKDFKNEAKGKLNEKELSAACSFTLEYGCSHSQKEELHYESATISLGVSINYEHINNFLGVLDAKIAGNNVNFNTDTLKETFLICVGVKDFYGDSVIPVDLFHISYLASFIVGFLTGNRRLKDRYYNNGETDLDSKVQPPKMEVPKEVDGIFTSGINVDWNS